VSVDDDKVAQCQRQKHVVATPHGGRLRNLQSSHNRGFTHTTVIQSRGSNHTTDGGGVRSSCIEIWSIAVLGNTTIFRAARHILASAILIIFLLCNDGRPVPRRERPAYQEGGGVHVRLEVDLAACSVEIFVS
jgi:hypothetical protein